MRIKIDGDLLNGSSTLLESQKNCRNTRAGKLHCAKFKAACSYICTHIVMSDDSSLIKSVDDDHTNSPSISLFSPIHLELHINFPRTSYLKAIVWDS